MFFSIAAIFILKLSGMSSAPPWNTFDFFHIFVESLFCLNSCFFCFINLSNYTWNNFSMLYSIIFLNFKNISVYFSCLYNKDKNKSRMFIKKLYNFKQSYNIYFVRIFLHLMLIWANVIKILLVLSNHCNST